MTDNQPKRQPAVRSWSIALVAWLLIQIAIFLWGTEENGASLITLRQSIFSRYIADPTWFDQAPHEMAAKGFAFANVTDQAMVRSGAVSNEISSREGKDTGDVLRRARDLVLEFSVGGGSTCGDYAGPSTEKWRWLRSGNGCCSDHTEAFLTIAARSGLIAREVSNAAHTVVEVYEPQLSRWIMIDPMGALFAENANARPLSVLELRSALLQKTAVRWRMFGKGWRHPRDTTAPWFLKTYGRGDGRDRIWSVLFWTWGNRVERVQQSQSASVAYKATVQFFDLLRGTQPGYVYLDDQYSVATLTTLKSYRVGFMVDLAVGLILLIGLSRSLFLGRGDRMDQPRIC